MQNGKWQTARYPNPNSNTIKCSHEKRNAKNQPIDCITFNIRSSAHISKQRLLGGIQAIVKGILLANLIAAQSSDPQSNACTQIECRLSSGQRKCLPLTNSSYRVRRNFPANMTRTLKATSIAGTQREHRICAFPIASRRRICASPVVPPGFARVSE